MAIKKPRNLSEKKGHHHSLNFHETGTERHIEMKFGYFGKAQDETCAVYADDELVLLLPKEVIEDAVHGWTKFVWHKA